MAVLDAPAAKKASSTVVDFITPETENLYWYFWGMARNFKTEDANVNGRYFVKDKAKSFLKTLEVLELNSKKLLAFPDYWFN